MDWLELVEWLFNGGELARFWRFLLCVVGSIALAVLICGRVQSRGWRVTLCAPVVVAGLATGIAWEIRKRD